MTTPPREDILDRIRAALDAAGDWIEGEKPRKSDRATLKAAWDAMGDLEGLAKDVSSMLSELTSLLDRTRHCTNLKACHLCLAPRGDGCEPDCPAERATARVEEWRKRNGVGL